jgi:hypothetical protein
MDSLEANMTYGDQVALLRQVLLVNSADIETVEKVTKHMKLKSYLSDHIKLELMLMAQFGKTKSRNWVQECVIQYFGDRQ